MTIAGNGHVTYEGRRNVQEIGVRTDDIAREDVVELLADFYAADYFAFRDEYLVETTIEVDDQGNVVQRTSQVTDLPLQQVRLELGPYVKAVRDYWRPPDALRELEMRIDETAGTERWVGGLH